MRPGQPVSKNDAAVLLRAVQRKTGVRLTMRQVPSSGAGNDPRQADREKAMRMIEGEMLASLRRCAALEGEL